ncbi:flagellar assembly protein FliW [Cellulomonas sp. zg-ZUI222]|uniref:Flagellar assembly protein FliW n=1 Tax=Cellulomonas wangleii TaxID=2816956 RepID=A0ABX8DAZ3_9CELL|nr:MULTISPECIES: flagellar assembly protein FliW [Cellulomonas]MBO0901288.1 flagellar assembly protein FliW [Cellulomonas sp. zg-ZUI22]MBO0922403.1 flagellar assembly protein FliW [Cellulomonas wangleii]MBO0924844.1 flagellar assembly protein FliW [Cellulomonas wangleii]QVI63012.1 flagellar assembly protein FliW [Cellulomonas wangleii]
MTAVQEALVTVTTPAGPREVPATLRVPGGLPGLPGHDAYALDPLDGTGVLFALRSEPSDGPAVRLFAVEPHAFFPDYAPELPAGGLAALGLDVEQDGAPVLLAVVHPADDDRDRPTANLLAPLVVHPRDGRVAQVVLDSDHPLRAPLG